MDKNAFSNLLANKILILDGATGTELQKRGMPKGVCPEKWVSENPDSIIAVQKDYIEAGSNVVYSCTFGANRFKLEEFGLENEVYALNKRLVEISREAVGKSAYVAGDMSPTGKFVEPFGDVNFDNMVSIYSEQAKGLLDGGADFFVIETMIDIQETRAAVIAIKELCDLPIIVSMTFGEDGYTLTGTDPVTALVCLQSLGVDAFGCNCSTGPDKMIEVIKSLKPYSKIPLVAKPNAGLPKLINGKTIFDMSVKEFGSYAEEFVKAGVNLYGGCCG
ncbi:MAG TPA: homocysteine S-methyltransferase family protein, partial [Spirochaetota bacterium]|nr:homocysteine S-methyltransferase family protein [Spirochaetota bacterium]